MIYISINSKGGVGKSTTANQILSSYLYHLNNTPVQLIEIDDENNDSAIFSQSKILQTKSLPTAKIKEIDEIFISEEDIILDIGGNKTATLFLDEMRKLGEFENIRWFIPVGQGVQDNANALDTYHAIKELDTNALIIFVLSNVRTDDLKWEFMYFFGNEFLDTPLAICTQIDNPNYIVIPSNEVINNSKTFMKTVLDISQNNIDFRAKAKAEKDSFKRRKFLFLNRVKNEATQYIASLQDKVYPELDRLLRK